MALFWIVKPKPKSGFETKYNEIKKEIESIAEILDSHDITNEEAIILNNKLNQLINEINDNTISKYETAKSPKLGFDKEIDRLILEKYYISHPYAKIKTLNEFYKDNSNKYYCEYSIQDSIGYTDSTGITELDFKANPIIYSDYLSKEIRILAQQSLTPNMMLILSNMIENEIVNIPDSNFKDLYIKAIKWLRFWSNSGHNICAYFD